LSRRGVSALAPNTSHCDTRRIGSEVIRLEYDEGKSSTPESNDAA